MNIDFDVLSTYIKPDVFILIPVLYIVGLLLRQTPYIPKWVHAWIKLIVAYITCAFILGNNVNAFIQAVLVTGAAVFLKDLFNHTVDGVVDMSKSGETKNDNDKKE